MSRLVRLFPRAWRDRYADEFEALLDELPRSPRSTIDIVAAAIRARWVAAMDATRPIRARSWSLLGQQPGATAAVAGGGLWALTFGVGNLVQWGRYGRDWGFVLLIAAAALILAAQLILVSAGQRRGRFVAWLGASVSAIGTMVLVLALIDATALGPPSWLLGWSPPQLWEAGMVLWLVGVGLFGVGGIAAGGAARTTGSLMILASIPLLVWLVADVPSVREAVAPAMRAISPELHESVAASVRLRDVQEGWFISPRLLVAVPGIVLGLAWLALGVANVRHRARPETGPPAEDVQLA